jgi:outer membrane protein OmpA-like peptidoglycan-associated protein
MKYLVNILLAILLVVMPARMSAQTGKEFSPYGFLQLQAGGNTTFTNVKQLDILSPTFTVGVGAMVIPELGARVNMNGWQSKGGFRSTNQKYKYNYFNADVDVILNVFNLFSKNYNRLFDVSLVAGVGINHAWNNDISKIDLTKVTEDVSNAWGKNLQKDKFNGTSFRMGVMGDFRLNQNWQLGLEVDMNSLHDDWNAKYSKKKRDWMLTSQVSVTYRFGGKKKKATAEPVVVPTYVEKKIEEPAKPIPPVVTKPQPKPEEPLNEVIVYTIRETDVNKEEIIQKIADWSKKHENGKIQISGYADKGTGTPSVNMYYSKQRAEKVAAALKAKGVPEGKMTVHSYGDTVQPFKENNQNRCVIVMGQ